jgi:hypothetical protein
VVLSSSRLGAGRSRKASSWQPRPTGFSAAVSPQRRIPLMHSKRACSRARCSWVPSAPDAYRAATPSRRGSPLSASRATRSTPPCRRRRRRARDTSGDHTSSTRAHAHAGADRGAGRLHPEGAHVPPARLQPGRLRRGHRQRRRDPARRLAGRARAARPSLRGRPRAHAGAGGGAAVVPLPHRARPPRWRPPWRARPVCGWRTSRLGAASACTRTGGPRAAPWWSTSWPGSATACATG